MSMKTTTKKRPSWKSRTKTVKGKRATRYPKMQALQQVTVYGDCPVPDVYNCVFTFAENYPALPAIGNNFKDQQYYSGNSIFDPDITGATGTQPYYYDQLLGINTTGLYTTYNVYASQIEVEAVPSVTNNQVCHIWVIPISSSNVTLPGGSATIINPDVYPRAKRMTIGTGANANTVEKITYYLPTYVHENITLERYHGCEEEYSALANTNPAFRSRWLIFVEPVDQVSQTVYLRVKIKYWSKLSERNQSVLES